jgi:hypothetical protein
MMAAGLRATAKAVEHPPEPNVGAPVLDPTRQVELVQQYPIARHAAKPRELSVVAQTLHRVVTYAMQRR